MADKRAVFHPLSTLDAKIVVQTRELIACSLKLLQECPKPDTFLGRKTQVPFHQSEAGAKGT